jgi:hypothetical protein
MGAGSDHEKFAVCRNFCWVEVVYVDSCLGREAIPNLVNMAVVLESREFVDKSILVVAHTEKHVFGSLGGEKNWGYQLAA